MTEPTLLDAALTRFNALNAEDPNTLAEAGAQRPRELVQAERLERWVLKLAPDASPALRLAARCQHLRRWAVPRADYPEGRVGYLTWRKDLSRFHADSAEHVLVELGFDEATRAAVRRINLKQGLKTEPETQTMEDALCLAFLEHDFEAFADGLPDDKVVDIVQKTWRKMSDAGHDAALRLSYSPRMLGLIQRALSA